ncbi:MAG: hypothetical protein AAFW75_25540, partial [Cyanobacteria bacterium J06636_16]
EKLGFADKGYTPSVLTRRHGIGFGHNRQAQINEQSKLITMGRLIGPESSDVKQPSSVTPKTPWTVTADVLNQMLQRAWQLFWLNHCYGQLADASSEQPSNLRQLSISPYTLTYDVKRNQFAIDASDRGRLITGQVHAENGGVELISVQQQANLSPSPITEAEQSVFEDFWQTQINTLTQDSTLSHDKIIHTVQQAMTEVRQVPDKLPARRPKSSVKKQLSLLDE